MHTPVKMHRPTAVIAALLMILSDGMNAVVTITNFTLSAVYIDILILATHSLLPVLCVVILLRGKKDVFPGVVFAAAALISVLNAWISLLGLLTNLSMNIQTLDHYAVTTIICNLVMAVFMVLLGVECLSKGKISAGRLRAVLWILPVVILGCKIWQMVPLYLQDSMTVWETVLAFLTENFPKRLAHILMGVSMSIPQKAKT